MTSPQALFSLQRPLRSLLTSRGSINASLSEIALLWTNNPRQSSDDLPSLAGTHQVQQLTEKLHDHTNGAGLTMYEESNGSAVL